MTQGTTDEHDPLVAEGAHGVLGRFNRAGVLTAADVHVAQRLGRLGGETDDQVLLAVALAVRAVRSGSVCLDLTGAGADLVGAAGHLDGPTGASADEPGPGAVAELTGFLPEPGDWWVALERSPLLGTALQREAGLLYLDRYWREETEVVSVLVTRASATPPAVDDAALEPALTAAFPEAGSEDQRRAAETALRSWTSVVTGGPGTGKTTTVARLLGVLEELAATEGRPLRVALAAPTGKAAARMTEAVRSAAAGSAATAGVGSTVSRLEATTLHRLLGWRPDSRTRFRHDRSNPLPHDVVVVDETSMLSLTLTARLLEAVRPSARLVLVGDADQLASVEAGAVLTDLVEGYTVGDRPSTPDTHVHARRSPVARLVRSRRFGEGIGLLADAVRSGDEDAVLGALAAGGPVTWLRTGDSGDDGAGADVGDDLGRVEQALADHALALHDAAQAPDGADALRQLDRHRLLCAHRAGPSGVAHWNRRVERLLQERLGRDWLPEWYAGRPLVVNTNDHGLQLFNGDTAVVCRAADGGLAAVLSSGPHGSRTMATTRLPDVSTAHAMTVHRSQGSQFESVTLLLPEPSSRVLTRELLYTAVTRATTQVTVVGSEAAVRAAVSRRARRATGLGQRLRIGSPG